MKWSPLIAGIAAAVALALQQFLGNSEASTQVILMAVLLAVLGVVGTQLKGKGLTIAGIIGTLAYTFVTVYNGEAFTWKEFILASVIAILSLVAPSAVPEKDPEV